MLRNFKLCTLYECRNLQFKSRDNALNVDQRHNAFSTLDRAHIRSVNKNRAARPSEISLATSEGREPPHEIRLL